MPVLGRASLANLDTCHEDLQVLAHEAIARIDFSVTEGHRGREAQEDYVRRGLSQVHYPDSKHNSRPSMAAHFVPYPIRWPQPVDLEGLVATVQNDDDAARAVEQTREAINERVKLTGRFYLLAGIVLEVARELYERGIISHEVRWGGDWDRDSEILDQSFDDLAHFELVTPE